MNLDRVDNVQDMKINNNVIYAFGDEPPMIEHMFKIGDDVETNEIYKHEIEEYNRILRKDAESYKKGTVSNIQVVHDTETKNGVETNKIINTWICVTLDDDIEKRINQIYLQKVNSK